MDTATSGAPETAPHTGQARRYMWLITVQWPTGRGSGVATFSNTVLIPTGRSRLDILNQIRQLAMRGTGVDSLTILFFSLEPDRLTA